MVIIVFIVVAVISFFGSVQAGPVNMMVIKTTLSKNRRSGFYLSLGGCIPEMIYSSLAIFAGMAIEKDTTFMWLAQWATVIFFLIFGIYNIFFQSDKEIQVKGNTTIGNDFLKGFVLGILNPQLLIFWLGIFIYLNHNWIYLADFNSRFAFILGTSFGAFALLFLLNILADKLKEKIYSKFKLSGFNKLLGYFFIVLALAKIFFQLDKLFIFF